MCVKDCSAQKSLVTANVSNKRMPKCEAIAPSGGNVNAIVIIFTKNIYCFLQAIKDVSYSSRSPGHHVVTSPVSETDNLTSGNVA